MTRVNLLPAEIVAERAAARLSRRILTVGAWLAILLMGLYGIRTFEVLQVRGQLDDLRAEQQVVQQQLDELADVAAARESVEAASALAIGLLDGEVSWAEQLLTVATAVPPSFTLTALDGRVGPISETGVIGSISFTATSRAFVPTQQWLIRLAAQEGWVNPWLSGLQGDGQSAFSVVGSVDLTPQIVTARGGGPA